MAEEEAAIGVSDIVTAELVECAISPPIKVILSLFDNLPESPTQQGFKAEIEQVGAQPPPVEGRYTLPARVSPVEKSTRAAGLRLRFSDSRFFVV